MRAAQVEDQQAEVEEQAPGEVEELALAWRLCRAAQRAIHFGFVVEKDEGALEDAPGEGELAEEEEADEEPGPENEVEEELVVVEADARVDPVAVVVHLQHAAPALAAVVRAGRLDDQALRAEAGQATELACA